MLPVSGIGFKMRLARAPPEVAVHLEWNGRIRVNGAKCGGFQIAASTTDADQQPDWLCIGLDLPLWPAHEEMGKPQMRPRFTPKDAPKLMPQT